MRACIFHPEAIAEAEATATFYEERQKGLGARFEGAQQAHRRRVRLVTGSVTCYRVVHMLQGL